MTNEDRIARLEAVVAKLIDTLIDRSEGLDGNCGRPDHLGALKEAESLLSFEP